MKKYLPILIASLAIASVTQAQVLYQGKDARLAAMDLLGREKRDE